VHERAPTERRPPAPERADPSADPRRVRVEVPGLFGDEARARRLEQRLRGLEGVLSAHASARTGRALLELGAGAGVLSRARETLAAEIDLAGPEAPSLGKVAARLRAGVAGLVRTSETELRRRANGGRTAPEDEAAPSLPAFHAWEAERVARELGVDPARGLDPEEAEARLQALGPNVLAGIEPRSAAAIVAGQALTVPNAILAASAGASALLGDVLEAAAIGAVVGTNVAVGYFTERRAEELLHAWGQLRVERARVLRGGRELRIPAARVVPGDVLVLGVGDGLVADARVFAASDLAADESTLTGESEPAEKRVEASPEDAGLPDRDGMVYAGTAIACGSGRAIVTATGEATELGAVRRALAGAGERTAPLEQQLDQLGKRLAGLSMIAAGGVVALGLLRGRPAGDVARCAVALGVAAIPEGIPTAGTTALALASRKLFRRGIVIRKLAAAETLGAVSAVCADKTGTLTLNRMRVEALALPGEGLLRVRWEESGLVLDGAGGDARSPDARAMRDLARVAALNADVEIGEGGAVRRGSGTERALYELAVAAGFPASRERRRARRVGEERRSAERPFMVTVHDDPELGRIELVKGAPEPVLELCDLPDGGAEAHAQNEAMASRGLRVLAFAWRKHAAADQRHVFLGLVGLHDPPRPGVGEAILALRRAGVRTYMLTGDQERTAQAVAASLGIDPDAVYSRVTPEAKVQVVRELEARGQLVAMTGDGINDGPALKAADVGIAMGMRGTDVARAVADVVLARDDLPAIVEAVAEGRRLHDNVRRAIDYLVATNMGEVLVMILGGLSRRGPLSPLQLLWLNMLTDVAPALALATEPADPRVMDRPPRDPKEQLFGGGDYLRLGRAAAEMAAASLGAWALGAARRGRGAEPQATAFTALATAQILHTFSCRSEAGAPNPVLAGALAAAAALQLAGLTLRPLRAALSMGSTGALDLALAALAGAVPAGLAWARRPRVRDEIVIERPREESPP
jgi:P-type Ca2+ transporter type 2C